MAEPLLIAKNGPTECFLLPELANRHGLITGATGTGKTVTLQTMAENFSSIGVPGTNGFVGEFLVLLGSFRTFPVLTIIATTAVIFAAAYLLWAIQRILFNALDKPANTHVPDLNRRELLLMAPLVAAIIWLGVYPAPVLRRMQPSAERFVQLVEQRAARPVAAMPGEVR